MQFIKGELNNSHIILFSPPSGVMIHIITSLSLVCFVSISAIRELSISHSEIPNEC